MAHLIVFTGDGKGKTSAALGCALRSYGIGRKVFAMFFMKGKKFEHSEIAAFKKMGEIDFEYSGCDEFLYDTSDKFDHLREADRGFQIVKTAVESQKYDVIILDEIASCINEGLIDIHDVIELIDSINYNIDVIITGRDADPELIKRASIVTEMKCVKHEYNDGVIAKLGIDY